MVTGPKQKKLDSEILRAREKIKTALAELRVIEQSIGEAVSLMGDIGSDAFTCPGCDHFNDGFCQLHGDKIPKSFLAKGCDQWSEALPF
jgi:hypothetical protein